MVILDFNRPKTLADFYQIYVTEIERTKPKEIARREIAKFQTAFVRYFLPGIGFPLKLEGNLTHQDITAALLLMQQIPLSQIEKALEIQEGVFQQFGDRISPAVRRVYRSALRKSLEWAQHQDMKRQLFWPLPANYFGRFCCEVAERSLAAC